MKTMSIEHLFVKPITKTIMGKEIEVKPLDAETGLVAFSQISDADKKTEAMKELVWQTIKVSECYNDLPEDKNVFFKKVGFAGLMDWLSATLEANHLDTLVDKKKVGEDILT